jgi:hypothetical protein
VTGPRKTTTQQGLGWSHQKARAKALREMQEGEDCPFCGEGMYREQKLDYDHVVPRSQGGTDGPRRLSHASCNRQAGGRLGAKLTNARKRAAAAAPPPPGAPCYDCGQPLLAGRPWRSGAAGYGGGTVWSHARCAIRYTSVPVDRL